MNKKLILLLLPLLMLASSAWAQSTGKVYRIKNLKHGKYITENWTAEAGGKLESLFIRILRCAEFWQVITDSYYVSGF